eukprot:264647_1
MIMRISVHVLREPVMESRDRKLQFNPKKRTKKESIEKYHKKHSNRNRNQKQIQSKNTRVFELANTNQEPQSSNRVMSDRANYYQTHLSITVLTVFVFVFPLGVYELLFFYVNSYTICSVVNWCLE